RPARGLWVLVDSLWRRQAQNRRRAARPALARSDHDLVPLERARLSPELRRLRAAALRGGREPGRAAVPRRGKLDTGPLQCEGGQPPVDARGRAVAPAGEPGAGGAERERDAPQAPPLRGLVALPPGLPPGRGTGA